MDSQIYINSSAAAATAFKEAALGLTGAPLYHNGNFAQVLEGP